MEQQQIVQAAEIPTPTTPTQSGEIKLEQRILRDVQKSLGGTVPPSISQPNCQTQAKPNKSPREPTDMNVKSEEKVNLSDSCRKGDLRKPSICFHSKKSTKWAKFGEKSESEQNLKTEEFLGKSGS